jgi:hypothetical protein
MRTSSLALVLFVSTAGCGNLYEMVPVRVPVAQTAVTSDTDQSDSDPRALTAFVTQLEGYGSWSDDDEYGTVWTPNDVDFVPYVSDGRWASLDDDIGDGADAVWLADTTWGAATCHHGRWISKPGVGAARRWHWVPGLRYAGSWARWTHDGDRLAVAPASPGVIWRHGAAERIGPRPVQVVDTRARSEIVDAAARPDLLRVASDDLRRVQIEHHVARLTSDALEAPGASEHSSRFGASLGHALGSASSAFSGHTSHGLGGHASSSSHGGGGGGHGGHR